MHSHNITLLIIILLFSFLTEYTSAQYWFQSGVTGLNSSHNNGGSVQIETVIQKPPKIGSLGFWIGENLKNGAFLQIGYLIINKTGYYPDDCNINQCSSNIYLVKGDAEWFYEYFPEISNSSFLGKIGPLGSAGRNGTFNNYSFNSSGNIWRFYFNGENVGSINLNTSQSGSNLINAISEYANANNNSYKIEPVIFKNLEYYKNDSYKYVLKGEYYIGYGGGSKTNLPNPYGVSKVNKTTNEFEAGSGIPLNNLGFISLNKGYTLKINSQYGNLNQSTSYKAYSIVNISSPNYYYINSTTRELFVGWKGLGNGSYSGNSPNASVQINSNITEIAEWHRQYYINATTNDLGISGGGWYNASSKDNLSVYSDIIKINNSSRFVLKDWSINGNIINYSYPSLTLFVNKSYNIEAIYAKELKVNFNLLNIYNKSINFSSIMINGEYYNNSVFLYKNSTYKIESVVYDKNTIPINKTFYIQNTSYYIKVPVYNSVIYTKGNIFNEPMNVSIRVLFKNNTTINYYTGKLGKITIKNIYGPYKFSTKSQLGLSFDYSVSKGDNKTLYFLSYLIIGLFIAVLLIILILSIFLFKHKKVQKQKRSN